MFTRSGPFHINPKKGTLMTATMEAPQSTSLYYREGSSDKEYHVRLEAKGDGFVVNTAFGRRGSTLSTGTKTSAPVSYDTALHLFERLVQEKQAKGYTAGANDTPYQPSANASQVSGLLPELLNAVVAQVNAQRSVGLALLNHEGWQPVGNVTIPPNHKVPKVGAVVEVRYLYAHRDGSLYQPVYLGERSDVTVEECVCSQLKFKRDDDEV